MELDVVGYNPHTKDLVHYEPSLDADRRDKRKARYETKFEAGRKYILRDIFSWLEQETPLRQIAIFSTHPRNRHEIAGEKIISVDEFVAEVRLKIVKRGPANRNAISENYPLLRTLQLSHCGYSNPIEITISNK